MDDKRKEKSEVKSKGKKAKSGGEVSFFDKTFFQTLGKFDQKASRKKVLGIVLAVIMIVSMSAGIVASSIVNQNESPVGSQMVSGAVEGFTLSESRTFSVSATTTELIYDDGEPESAWTWFDPCNLWAVRFTPPSYPVDINTARIALADWDWPDSDHEEFAVEVYDDDGAGNAPETLLGTVTTTATAWGWHDVDLSGLGITITDGDFYIAYHQLTTYNDTEGLCIDTDGPDYGRSWQKAAGGDWETLPITGGPEGNWMIRCVVISEPVTTGLRVNVMPEYYTFTGTSNIIWGNCHWDLNDTAHTGTYNWTFDDGTFATGTVSDTASWDHARYIAETHTYANEGVYEATLTVTSDFDGSSDSDTVRINVYNATTLSPEQLEKAKVNKAIEDGLRWLYNKQYTDGKWGGYGSYWTAGTGEAVLAFENQGHLPSNDINEDIYAEYVQMGLDYLFGQLSVQTLSDQTYIGNPDTNGNGRGLYWPGEGRPIYSTPIAMMAVIGSLTPDEVATTGDATYVNGRTYRDIIRDVCDYLAWAQNEAGGGNSRGGWRYTANYASSDNSVAQWPALGLLEAEERWSITAPVYETVKDELERWLDYSQNANGGFGYTSPTDWVNIAKTGAGLIMLNYIDADNSDSRVINATIYLNNTWDTNNADPGWRVKPYGYGSFYGMYAVYKGCKDAKPSEIEYLPLPGGSRDWYADFVDYLLNTQNVDGSWPAGKYGDDDLDTMWSILILSPTVLGGPVADAGPGQKVSVHQSVTFDGSGSYHTVGLNLTQYLWDFDASDGVDWTSPDASGKIVTYAAGYPASGTYTVTLRVKDELNNTDIDTAKVTVEPIISGDMVYFVPQNSSATHCSTTDVEIWINATAFKNGQINMSYDPSCANVTNYVANAANFPMYSWDHYVGREWITFMATARDVTGTFLIGTLTIHCVNDSEEGCETPLDFVEGSILFDKNGVEIPANWIDGSFKCILGICGDVNCDGNINMGDVGLLHNYVAYPGEFLVCDEWAANVNCDGNINMGDVGLLHNYVAYPGEFQLNCC